MTLILNCSYRANGKARDLAFKIKEARFPDADIIFLPEVIGCYDCENKKCQNNLANCTLKDKETVVGMHRIIDMYDTVVFVTPVYLNMPTPKLMAFLSRLNTRNDVIGRNMFEGKTAYIACIADVSGTQQTASILMNALNMLGFGFRGKCVLERINEWNSPKVRGGFLSEEIPYME